MALPAPDVQAVALLVLGLGLRHGMDPDHLATIDGLARFNAVAKPRLARCCGVLFSTGHGLVMTGVALAVTLLAAGWRAPAWAETFGEWASIAVLAALGCANLYVALRTPAGQVVSPVGLKSRWLIPITRTSHPLAIMLIGAVFAVSFDTIGQATLISLIATQSGAWPVALLLGATFTFGMLITDGANGFWISRLMTRADRTAVIVSRVMSIVVAGISLSLAAYGLAATTSATARSWLDGRELVVGAGLTVLIAAGYLLAIYARPATAE
jgi:nickel/cobalt transporter (NiCoT) family protein